MRRLTLFLLLASGAANAGIVIIDAASYSPGANITAATPGVTLQEITNYGRASGYAVNPIYTVLNPGGYDAGPNLIGHNNAEPLLARYHFSNNPAAVNCYVGGVCGNSAEDYYRFNSLLMTFEYPTNLIEMRVHRTDSDLDWSYLNLYNKQKQLLASCYVPGQTTTRYPFYVPAKPGVTIPCGELVRSYDCTGAGCKAELLVRVTRSYPDIAFAIFGSEGADATRGAVNRISFRRFSDCAP